MIAQLADVGENALRRIVERPRRMVDGIEQRLRDFAGRLRAIDPLDRRVAALEKRLDSLEQPKAATARRQSGSGKPSTSRTGRAAVATKPGPAEHDLGSRSDAGVEGELSEPTRRLWMSVSQLVSRLLCASHVRLHPLTLRRPR